MEKNTFRRGMSPKLETTKPSKELKVPFLKYAWILFAHPKNTFHLPKLLHLGVPAMPQKNVPLPRIRNMQTAIVGQLTCETLTS